MMGDVGACSSRVECRAKTSSGTSMNEGTENEESTVSETSFDEGAESGSLVGASVGEQTEPERSVSEVGDHVMLDGESGDVSEAAVGDGAVMMGDVGACSSRLVVECGANGSSSFDVDSVVDIGCVVELNMTVEEVVKSVTCLNVQQKYKLLTEHFVPTSMFKFPNVMLDGESGDVSEAAVGDGAVMMGDVGACSSRVVVECGANGSSSFDVDSVVDIGCVVELNMTVEEVVKSVTCLNVQQKYKLLTEHFVPTSMFKFPKVFDSGCNRSFQIKWLEQYPWLVYSKALDGGFCKYCALCNGK